MKKYYEIAFTGGNATKKNCELNKSKRTLSSGKLPNLFRQIPQVDRADLCKMPLTRAV